MQDTATLANPHADTETLLREFADASICYNATSKYQAKGYTVSGYWPNDSLRGKFCLGSAPTLAGALADYADKIAAAKVATQVLRTAKDCKDAVIALIREHDAAPAAFRDAVDALPVSAA